MDLTAQESIFNTYYSEYKEYETFFKNQLPEIKKEREDFEKFAFENSENKQLLMDKLFEINQKPSYYQNDLITLQNRLLYTYNAYKNLLDIPEDIRKEVTAFKEKPLIYKIEKNQAVELDPDYIIKMRSVTKNHYSNFLKNIIK